MSNDNDIYTDKIKIGLTILTAELDFINTVNALEGSFKLNEEDISFLAENEDYHRAFIQLKNLYDFLKYDYYPQVEPELNKKFIEYLDNYHKGIYKLEELIVLKDILLKVMSLAKFHDIVRFTYENEYTD